MNWVPDNIIEEMRGSHILGIFMRVATEPPLHVWVGMNDIPAGFDSIDPDGTVYLGGGVLIGFQTLEILVNGTSDAVEFTVSGIDPETGSRMIDSMPPVRGADVAIGITTLDQYFQPMSKIIPLWPGKASHVSETAAPVKSGETMSLTLSLSVVSGEATRSRAAGVLWSPAHQEALSSGDKFCNNTPRLAREVQPVWPNYS